MNHLNEYDNWNTTASDNVKINYGDVETVEPGETELTTNLLEYIKKNTISIRIDDDGISIFLDDDDIKKIIIRYNTYDVPEIFILKLSNNRTIHIKEDEYEYLGKELGKLHELRKEKEQEPIINDFLDEIVPFRKDAKKYNL